VEKLTDIILSYFLIGGLGAGAFFLLFLLVIPGISSMIWRMRLGAFMRKPAERRYRILRSAMISQGSDAFDLDTASARSIMRTSEALGVGYMVGYIPGFNSRKNKFTDKDFQRLIDEVYVASASLMLAPDEYSFFAETQ
jgi:hypothetical protein